MGACDISFIIGKKATVSEVGDALQARRAEDREENGHQEGYSGDFQTVTGVECHFNTVFTSHREAMDYCLSKAEKWGNAIAVHYVQINIEASKLQKKLEEKIVKLKEEQRLLHRFQDKTGFVKCKHCGSRLNKKHMLYKTCRLCDQSLLTNTEQRKADRLDSGIKQAQEKIASIVAEARKKAIEKNQNKNLKTLVAGWGAC